MTGEKEKKGESGRKQEIHLRNGERQVKNRKKEKVEESKKFTLEAGKAVTGEKEKEGDDRKAQEIHLRSKESRDW